MSRDWSSGLFDCFTPFSTCLMGTFLPCILYGQISEKKNNPTSSPSGINGACCGWYALSCCGLQCILQMSTRRELRSQHNIAGDGATDFLISWCCCCCGLVQEHKELEAVEKAGYQGQGQAQGYVAPNAVNGGGMVYQQPGGAAGGYAQPQPAGGVGYAKA